MISNAQSIKYKHGGTIVRSHGIRVPFRSGWLVVVMGSIPIGVGTMGCGAFLLFFHKLLVKFSTATGLRPVCPTKLCSLERLFQPLVTRSRSQETPSKPLTEYAAVQAGDRRERPALRIMDNYLRERVRRLEGTNGVLAGHVYLTATYPPRSKKRSLSYHLTAWKGRLYTAVP